MKESQYVAEVFDISCRGTSTGWEAGAWSSEDSQRFLFEWCLATIGELNDDTLLDVGCGHADLFAYLNENPNYTGIDVSKEMIKAAWRKYPDARVTRTDIDCYNQTHDWVLGVGPFNLDLTFSPDTKLPYDFKEQVQMRYLNEVLRHMYRLANKGMVLTLLSANLVKEQQEGLFYYQTDKVIQNCCEISPRFMMDHLSNPNQFLIFIPK